MPKNTNAIEKVQMLKCISEMLGVDRFVTSEKLVLKMWRMW